MQYLQMSNNVAYNDGHSVIGTWRLIKNYIFPLVVSQEKAMPTCSIIPDFSEYACIEIFALLTCRKLSPGTTIRLTS